MYLQVVWWTSARLQEKVQDGWLEDEAKYMAK